MSASAPSPAPRTDIEATKARNTRNELVQDANGPLHSGFVFFVAIYFGFRGLPGSLTAVEPALDYWPRDCENLEESLKSRIIVWTLVAIVVIIGVIAVLTAPKTSSGPKVTADALKSELVEAETQLERLVARTAERRKSVAPGAGTERLDEADRLLAEAREKLGQAKQATDDKETRQLLIDGRETLRKARRAVELATKPSSRPPGMY